MPLRDMHGSARHRAAAIRLCKAGIVSDVQAVAEDEFSGTGGAVRDPHILERWTQYRYVLVRSSAEHLPVRGVPGKNFFVIARQRTARWLLRIIDWVDHAPLGCQALEQAEINDHLRLGSDRPTAFNTGSKTPFHDGFDGFLVQAEAEGPYHVNVARGARGIDHDR